MPHFVAGPAAFFVQELLPKSWTSGNEPTITASVGIVMRVLIALSVYVVGAWLGGGLQHFRQGSESNGKKDRSASGDDDDVSTNVDSSDHSSSSDTDDHDEFTSRRRTASKPQRVRLPSKTGCVIDSATFLRLRTTKGPSPPGYLHAAFVQEEPEPSKPSQRKTSGSDRRWESLRTDNWETLRGSESQIRAPQRVADFGLPPGIMSDDEDEAPCKQQTMSDLQSAAPWRKARGSTGTLSGSLTSQISSGGLRPSGSSSLSSGLVGSGGLRPQRKL